MLCKWCKISFNVKSIVAHSTYCKLNPKYELNRKIIRTASMLNGLNRTKKCIIKYDQNPKYCKFCNLKIPYESRYNKFCNSSCAATYNRTGVHHTAVTIENISNGVRNSNKNTIAVSIRNTNNLNKKKLLETAYYENPKKCKICSAPILYEKRKNVICSKQCFCLLRSEYASRDTINIRSIRSKYFCIEKNQDVWLDSTWEVEYAKYLDMHNIRWIKAENFPYVDDLGKNRKYRADFKLIESNEYIDIKNDWLIQLHNRKIQLVKEQNNINLKLLSNADLIKLGCNIKKIKSSVPVAENV